MRWTDSAIKESDFMKKNENDEIILFLHFYVYVYCGFLNCCRCFLWKAYQTVPPCKNFPNGLLAKPGKHYQIRNTQHFNKTATCSHHCPLWHEHSHWGIGILGYTLGSMIQARVISPPSWALFPDDYRQSIESPMDVLTFNYRKDA